MFGLLGSALLKPLISGVSGWLQKRSERKMARELAEAKVKAAKVSGDQEVTLKDAEWESLAVSGLSKTWKDEYLTVIITSPLILIFLGALWLFWTGDSALIDATIVALTKLGELGIDMGALMYIVTLAGVGLKLWRAR